MNIIVIERVRSETEAVDWRRLSLAGAVKNVDEERSIAVRYETYIGPVVGGCDITNANTSRLTIVKLEFDTCISTEFIGSNKPQAGESKQPNYFS